MIDGYKQLNENIQQTINLISDIQNASKEQLLGIEQINDAVTQLDQQTQKNAAVASQAHDVSVITDKIAKLVVSNANEKEFEGKHSVKAKKYDGQVVSNQTITSKPQPIKTEATVTVKKEVKKEITANTKDNDEWESF